MVCHHPSSGTREYLTLLTIPTSHLLNLLCCSSRMEFYDFLLILIFLPSRSANRSHLFLTWPQFSLTTKPSVLLRLVRHKFLSCSLSPRIKTEPLSPHPCRPRRTPLNYLQCCLRSRARLLPLSKEETAQRRCQRHSCPPPARVVLAKSRGRDTMFGRRSRSLPVSPCGTMRCNA